jgi:oxygen-independent coproporphyrinogen III oxidase
MSWCYYPELLTTPVPRYTSYPTAAEFHDRVGPADKAAALAGVEAKAPVSLYLHIPYCHEICWYCGCNTGAANRAKRLAAYLEALEAEIELIANRLGGRGQLQRIAFGGGSPNAISADAFLRLLARVYDAFGTAPVSVEVDPRNLSDAWLDAIQVAGVARVSLGVQTLEDHVQHAIGRVQPVATIIHAVDSLRGAGVTSINFDLMYGLPRQSPSDIAATLEATIAMRPERIALFGYAHVPHMMPRQRRIDEAALPGAEQRFRSAEQGFDRLVAAGYLPVGFDHFALPGDALAEAAAAGTLRRNFQGFTEDSAEVLIGLGASAISAFPDKLLQNEKNVGRYRMLAAASTLPVTRGLLRHDDDRVRAACIESILCRGHANVAGLPDRDEIFCRLLPFEERGLIDWRAFDLRLADAARPYARAIASTVDIYRQPQAQRFSSAI